MKRWLTIQEHNADRAGLHWDLRIENDAQVMLSWVIPKHRMPEWDEKLLALRVSDHSWNYRNFEGELTEGYGKGSVKLIHSAPVNVLTFEERKVKFKYDKRIFNMHVMAGNKWLIYEV